MKFDPVNLRRRDAHRLLVSTVLPRPIAWVSTVDQRGIFNLAPFSDYCLISSKPAMVGIGIGATRDGQKKDTLRNIEVMKDFVINVADESFAEAMNQTSASYPADVSEFKEVGLTPVDADLVKAPMVAESQVNIECRVVQILEFGEAPLASSFVIGDVLRVHVKDEVYIDGEIQISKLKAIGRLGGDLYCRTQDIFEMNRPS